MPYPKGVHNCRVCRHPQRAEIEAALAAGVPPPKIGGQFWIAPEAVRYHAQRTALLQAEGAGGPLPTEGEA